MPVSSHISISSTPLPMEDIGLKPARLFTVLHLVPLIARVVPGVLEELPQTCERVPKESK